LSGQKGFAMSELRKHPRHLTLETAKIFVDSQSPPIACAILNISAGGVCILLPSHAYVPGFFDMVMDRDGTLHECRIAWRDGDRIGVSFSVSALARAKTAPAGAASAPPTGARHSAPSSRLRG
jgi:PilZ domain